MIERERASTDGQQCQLLSEGPFGGDRDVWQYLYPPHHKMNSCSNIHETYVMEEGLTETSNCFRYIIRGAHNLTTPGYPCYNEFRY